MKDIWIEATNNEKKVNKKKMVILIIILPVNITHFLVKDFLFFIPIKRH